MEREALRDTLKSPAGRVVLRTLLRRCGIYEGSQGEFAEGRRALGLELKQVLEELDPFAYADLLRDDIKARRDG